MSCTPHYCAVFARWRLRALVRLLASTLLPSRPAASAPHRALFLVYGGLGDRLMTLPALRLARQTLPAGAHMCVVWVEGDAGSVDLPGVRAVVARSPLHVAAIAAQWWDLVYVNCIGVYRAGAEIYALLSRAPRRLGPRAPGAAFRGSVYTTEYLVEPGVHLSALNCRPFSTLNDRTPRPYPLNPGAVTHPRSKAALRRIAIHAGARRGYEGKCWSNTRFMEVAALLARKSNMEVVVLQGPGEHTGSCPAGVRVTPCESVASLFVQIEGCSLLIGNDSGPAHVAAALGVAAVVVFGPTDEAATAPVGEMVEVVRAPCDCAPCCYRHAPCARQRCLESVTPQMVVAAAWQLLARQHGRNGL